MGTFYFAVAPFRGGIPAGSHNVYLTILIELGAVGFLMFVSIFTLALYNIIKLPKCERVLWFVLLAQWAVAAMTLNWFLYKGTWLLLGLSITHAVVMRYEKNTEKTYENLKHNG